MSRHRSNKSFFAHHRASSNKLCSLLNPPIHSSQHRYLSWSYGNGNRFIWIYWIFPALWSIFFARSFWNSVCETDKMKSVERNRDESPHSKVDHGGVFVADVCFRIYTCLNKQLWTQTLDKFYLLDQKGIDLYFQETPFSTIWLLITSRSFSQNMLLNYSFKACRNFDENRT